MGYLQCSVEFSLDISNDGGPDDDAISVTSKHLVVRMPYSAECNEHRLCVWTVVMTNSNE